MGKIILVTGGARSGKSRFAERRAEKYGGQVAYIATAQAYDEEMRFRIKLHRERRPARWMTYEAPYEAEKAIKAAAAGFILFDCLTLYISNMMAAADFPKQPQDQYRYVKARVTRLVEAAKASAAVVAFVTNEVGMGIVPLNKMAREYRDLAGIANELVAKDAAEVYLVVSGLAVDIKKIAANLEEEP